MMLKFLNIPHCQKYIHEKQTNFWNFLQVPSVLFAPSHLVSLLTLGLPSALVLDCGYTETLVLPVSFLLEILTAQMWHLYFINLITARIPKDAGRLCFHRCLSVHGGLYLLVPGP